ncbi:MAG: hypothetical protein HY855_03025 [Burkholderiales bacterium]|nr:hypothetical protein [Burkholderiales bacterium]
MLWGAGGVVAQPAAGGQRFWAPGDGQPLPAELSFPNASGALGLLNTGGAVDTRGHPFFTPLGTNGRACVSCHQPADGMSLSVATIRERWAATQGRDPMFAMVDGANCPNLPPGERASHSLLLDHGLFRIPRAWPPVGHDGKPITPQFDIQVVRDPTGCNTDAKHGLASAQPTVSVFRRPRPAANLKFITAVGFSFEPKSGLPLLRDPETGQYVSESLMADSRLLTLKAQALDAMRGHLEAQGQLSPEALQRMIDFENQVFVAQGSDRFGSPTDAAGAAGGPKHLAAAKAGVLQNLQRNPMWKEFLPWAAAAASAPATAGGGEAQQRWRASVARGAKLFSQRMFLVKDTGGINTFGFGNPVINSCATCHTMVNSGIDLAPGRVDLGTVNLPWAEPAPHLPLFKLSCKPGHKPHPFLGREVYTHDPGYALTTGRCEDIGKITTQSMRGLASRAPYFANGSAPTLRALVDFYNRRYNIRLSAEEIEDLVNLLGAL